MISSHMQFIKPNRLQPGDTVAVVSPSWGGPSLFPNIYESGISTLKDKLGLKIKEYPTARMNTEELYKNPKIRATDINNAFADTEVKAIFSTIGGEDSVRILPFLDERIILSNPKIIMGYSDTSTLLQNLNRIGLVTFHGPSIMSGFAQAGNLPEEFM